MSTKRPERLVEDAIATVRRQSGWRMMRKFVALATLPFDVVLAEVTLSIEDSIRGRDVDELLNEARLPLPDDPKRLIVAVWRQDVDDLMSYASGPAGQPSVRLIGALVTLSASLQEAAERTPLLSPHA